VTIGGEHGLLGAWVTVGGELRLSRYLLGARITPDGRTAMLMSGRTVRNFQGTGLSNQLFRKLRGEFPNVTKFVFGGDVVDASQKLRSLSQSHYLWVSTGE